MTEGVTVAEAARTLDVNPSTVRSWIARGAPTVVLGQAGRGRGSRVDVGALQRWRTGYARVDVRTDAEILRLLATSCSDTFKRDAGLGDLPWPAHRILGVDDWKAAGILVSVFERAALAFTGRIPDPLPAEIQILAALVAQNRA